ncbi:MAG: hypothetical protein RL367_551 [Pseudomonadota bacterium]
MADATDPRQAAAPSTLLPVVSKTGEAVPIWLVVAGLIAAALLLFTILNARRQAATVPAVEPRHTDMAGAPATVPPLFVPPTTPPEPREVLIMPRPPVAPVQRTLPPPPPRIIYYPTPQAPQPQQSIEPVVQPPRASSDATLVFDRTNGETGTVAPAGDGDRAEGAAGGALALRARASVMQHRATTVQQGTLIAAVLETAFDSTRAGLARALVTRDVYGFDGSRLLIPRGSRLIGEYKGDLTPGQNRALIVWTRLVRPDGAMIALGSPSADPLGRIGVKGKVNSHFFTRFGGALLQSSLDIGVALATQRSNSAVVVALPGLAQSAAAPLTSASQAAPTLKVRQGTTISVFVARDLDFTAVESRP